MLNDLSNCFVVLFLVEVFVFIFDHYAILFCFIVLFVFMLLYLSCYHVLLLDYLFNYFIVLC